MMRFSMRTLAAVSVSCVLLSGCPEARREGGSAEPVEVPRVTASLREAPLPFLPSLPSLPSLPCTQGTDPFLTVLEGQLAPGAFFRLLAVSETPLGTVRARVAGTALSTLHRPLSKGSPHAVVFRGRAPERPGRYAVRLLDDRCQQRACVHLIVSAPTAHMPRPAPASGVWRIRRGWHDGWERAFSAWIAHLFQPLPGQPAGWRPLHRVLRLPKRNLLHNRLGHAEDDYRSRVKVHAWADCGDTPYQLRAYFAWKFSLPFRYRRCSRGGSLRGPRCPDHRDNLTAEFDRIRHPVRRFNAFLRQGLAWWVHSGTMRTLPEDEGSDFYPIKLDRRSIRPGTVFVDVSGHALMVTQWDHRGLYAIDGHPDMSVTRRRFSEKHFRYFRGTRTGGFKAFRPLRLDQGRVVPVPNRGLRPFFSVEQYRFARRRDFYRQMHQLIATHAG
jgi:hypothetical protein